MKKALLSLALLAAGAAARSQILNPGFESMRTSAAGGPAHWGRTVPVPSPCAVQQGYDSVYFQTPDAHSGAYSLELRNAYCDASFFAGSVFAMQNDTNYFASGFPYAATPTAVSFFYKLFPASGDAGYVAVQLWDDINNTIIAEGEVLLSTALGIGYQSASVPLIYSTTTVPTRMTIAVGIRNDATNVHYGTRFLVDDFSDNGATAVDEHPAKNAVVVLSPNPATASVVSTESGELTLLDAMGRTILHAEVTAGRAVDVQGLPRGLYAYRLTGKTGSNRRGMLVLQ